MIQIHFIAADQSKQTIQARPGQSLMQAAVDAGLSGIAADCGGSLTCATCHVMIDEPWAGQLPPANADEQEMLQFAAAPLEPGSRLSCQIQLTPALNGLVVRTPSQQY